MRPRAVPHPRRRHGVAAPWLARSRLPGAGRSAGGRRQPHPHLGLRRRRGVSPAAATSATRSIWSSRRGETFVGLGAGDLEGLTFSVAGQSPVPEAARRGRRDQPHGSHHRGAPITSTTRASARRPDPRFAGGHLRAALHVSAARPRSTRSRASSARLQRGSRQPRPRNLDYWYCGSPALQPSAASDDGVQTRLTFGARQELPAMFVRNEDGSESLLNFSMDEGEVIVHRVARRFIVRRGTLHRLHRQSGLRRQRATRCAPGTVAPDVRARDPGGCAVSTPAPHGDPDFGTAAMDAESGTVRGERAAALVSSRAQPAVAGQQCAGRGPHDRARPRQRSAGTTRMR